MKVLKQSLLLSRQTCKKMSKPSSTSLITYVRKKTSRFHVLLLWPFERCEETVDNVDSRKLKETKPQQRFYCSRKKKRNSSYVCLVSFIGPMFSSSVRHQNKSGDEELSSAWTDVKPAVFDPLLS